MLVKQNFDFVKMKLFIPILLFSVFAQSCGPNENVTPKPEDNTISVEFTVKNSLANTIQGAEVTLYGSQNDWLQQSPKASVTKLSGADGKVKFENISPLKYYFWVEKGCRNNFNGAVRFSKTPEEGIIYKSDVIIYETGNITFSRRSFSFS